MKMMIENEEIMKPFLSMNEIKKIEDNQYGTI